MIDQPESSADGSGRRRSAFLCKSIQLGMAVLERRGVASIYLDELNI